MSCEDCCGWWPRPHQCQVRQTTNEEIFTRHLCSLGIFPLKMFRIVSRTSSTTLRRPCARRYATVSETIPDGPPVTATNREYVQALRETPTNTFSKGAQATQRRFWKTASVQKKDGTPDILELFGQNSDSDPRQTLCSLHWMTGHSRPLREGDSCCHRASDCSRLSLRMSGRFRRL